MSEKQYPSVEYLRQCFREENGRLFWLNRPREHFSTERSFAVCNANFAGKEAGRVIYSKRSRKSRWSVGVNWRSYFRASIIWTLHYGVWRVGIDHKNGNSLDDVISNLRKADQTQNLRNQKKHRDNASGYKGVSYMKDRNKWQAQIRIDGKATHLGQFNSPEEAYKAYCEAATKYFGEFARFE